MKLLRALSQSISAPGAQKAPGSTEVVRVEEVRPVQTEAVRDRRVQPDRRLRQLPFEGPDRRRKKSRRQPRLLHARTRKPTELEDRRGRNISTSA